MYLIYLNVNDNNYKMPGLNQSKSFWWAQTGRRLAILPAEFCVLLLFILILQTSKALYIFSLLRIVIGLTTRIREPLPNQIQTLLMKLLHMFYQKVYQNIVLRKQIKCLSLILYIQLVLPAFLIYLSSILIFCE